MIALYGIEGKLPTDSFKKVSDLIYFDGLF